MRLLGSACAAMNATMAVASAVAGIVIADAMSTAWAGLPAACGIAGTGVGSVALSRVMAISSRRSGLVAGYAVGSAGALAVAGAVTASGALGDVLGGVLLCVAMVVLGAGNAAAQLSRYAAADLYPPARRGAAVGAVVWAAAIGAVGGPLLLGPAAEVAATVGLGGSAAAMVVAAATCVVALFLSTLLTHRAQRPVQAAAVRTRGLLKLPAARSALAVMGTAQVVMVIVMTSTPVMLHHHGASLSTVGIMLSGHTLGMFALAPVASRLVVRYGPRPVMLGGLVLLAASCIGAGTTDLGIAQLTTLFLLGFAWNLCFVAGSTRVAVSVPAEARIHTEGAVDAAVWGMAAVAGALSCALLALGGYLTLTVLACVPIAVPVLLLLAEPSEEVPSVEHDQRLV